MNIKLSLVGFDKSGNPHQFSSLDTEKLNPDKRPEWLPCLYDKKGVFLGPIFTKNEYGKSVLLDAVELVRMRSYRWPLEQIKCSTNRNVGSTTVHMYLPSGAGPSRLVPVFDGVPLCEIPWTT